MGSPGEGARCIRRTMHDLCPATMTQVRHRQTPDIRLNWRLSSLVRLPGGRHLHSRARVAAWIHRSRHKDAPTGQQVALDDVTPDWRATPPKPESRLEHGHVIPQKGEICRLLTHTTPARKGSRDGGSVWHVSPVCTTVTGDVPEAHMHAGAQGSPQTHGTTLPVTRDGAGSRPPWSMMGTSYERR